MEHRNRCTDLRHPEALATCCPCSSVHLSNRIQVRPLFASKNDPSDGAGLGGPRVASRGSLLQANLHVHGKLVVQHPSKSKKVGQLPPLRSFNFLTLRHSATLRFPSPLIEPDVPISGIRLSDWLHREVHGEQTNRTRLRHGE
jgi:hypothetical protein